jgi:hypothetical protein
MTLSIMTFNLIAICMSALRKMTHNFATFGITKLSITIKKNSTFRIVTVNLRAFHVEC